MQNIIEARKIDPGDVVVRRQGCKSTVVYVITIDNHPRGLTINEGADPIALGLTEEVEIAGHVDPAELTDRGLKAEDVIAIRVRSAASAQELKRLAEQAHAAEDAELAQEASNLSGGPRAVTVPGAPVVFTSPVGVNPSDVARRAAAALKATGEESSPARSGARTPPRKP